MILKDYTLLILTLITSIQYWDDSINLIGGYRRFGETCFPPDVGNHPEDATTQKTTV
jgi:hypothetical protein